MEDESDVLEDGEKEFGCSIISGQPQQSNQQTKLSKLLETPGNNRMLFESYKEIFKTGLKSDSITNHLAESSVPGNEIEEEVTAQDNAEESIDEEVTCLGLGHQQENCAKPPTSPTSSSELIGVNDQIVEECDISSAPVSFSSSLAISREPETICSEESSDNSDDSDDDSDAQCSKPKKVKPQHQLPVSRKEVPNKYKVWSVAIQEEALTETLTKCDVEATDRERSVESYNYKLVDNTDYNHYNDYHMSVSECPLIENNYNNSKYSSNDRRYAVGSKRRHSDIKQRIGHRDNFQAYKMANLSVTVDDPAEDVADDIAKKLRESKVDLILNVVLVLGKEKAIALYNETKDVEDNGGMLLMNGERRRTAGGVYLLLLKRDSTISSDATKKIFNKSFLVNRKKKKAHRKKRSKKFDEIKETLIREKLLGLNTAAYPPESDTKQSGGLLDAESNNLEEGEVELTVTNPPPSPATDQDTPPSRTLVYSEDETDHVDTGTSICAESIGRKVVSYEDDDDGDFLDLDVDEMDVF